MEPQKANRGFEPDAMYGNIYSRAQAYAVLALMVLITVSLDLAKLPMHVMVDPIRKTLGWAPSLWCWDLARRWRSCWLVPYSAWRKAVHSCPWG